MIDLLVACDYISGCPSLDYSLLKDGSNRLARDIVTLVVEMASKRAQLVDFVFLVDFIDLLFNNKALSFQLQS